MSNTVLFLCTGNYYRSRFAELYFNALAATESVAWQADSRGLQLCPGNPGPISMQTVGWLEQRMGIRLPGTHRLPMPVCAQDLQSAQLVVAIKESEHRPLLTSQFPDWADRVEYWQIHDLDCATPVQALPELALKVEGLLRRLRQQA